MAKKGQSAFSSEELLEGTPWVVHDLEQGPVNQHGVVENTGLGVLDSREL